jgi:uncharacterized membrane protein HdeD (DUF308 family)
MEELRKQLRKLRNAGVLLLSVGALLLLAGVLLLRGSAGNQEALRDSFLCLLGGFMLLVGAAVVYHAFRATRLLRRMGAPGGPVQGH